MPRLMDADALLSEFLRRYTERERIRKLVFAACEIKQDFADMLQEFPTIEAEPVTHGRWVKDGDFLICLECESEINIKNSLGVENHKNYCPNCGAKMNGGAE